MLMAEDQSDEFKKFVLENREIIEAILNEGKKPEPSPQEAMELKLEQGKEKVKDLSDAILQIMSDDDVQKHFITGVLEFLHFFQSVIDAAPLSPDVREVVDKFEKTRDTTLKNVIAVGAKDTMENITINDVKNKSAASFSEAKDKLENISIRDIKDEVRKRL